MSLDGYARRDEDSSDEADIQSLGPDFTLLQKLASSATRWFCILRFRSKDEQPFQTNYSPEAFLSLFEQKKFTPGTLICGMTCRYVRKGIVLPGSCFRTYAFLMDQMKAGRSYIPLNDKDLDRGTPKPNWCKLPVFTQVKEDHGAPVEPKPKGRVVDPTRQAVWELLNRAPHFCLSYMFGFDNSTGIKCAINISNAELFNQWELGELNEWTPIVGLMDGPHQGKLWVPPESLLPFGYLLEMHLSGREYVPLSANDMKMVQSEGTQYLATRQLEALQSKFATKAIPKCPASMTEKQKAAEQAERARKDKIALAATVAEVQRPSSPPPSWLTQSPSIPSPVAVNGHVGGKSNTAATAAAQQRSSAALANKVQHMPVDGSLYGGSTSAHGQLPDFGTILSTTLTADSSASMFKTSIFRLFLGVHGQHGLSSCWWYIPASDSTSTKGPFSPEQMILAVIANLIETTDLVCGTEGDVLPPLIPTEHCFIPLSHLLQEEDRGTPTTLATRSDVIALMELIAGSCSRPAPGTDLGGGFIMPTPLPTMSPPPGTDVGGGFIMPTPLPVTTRAPPAMAFVMPTPMPAVTRGLVVAPAVRLPVATMADSSPVGVAPIGAGGNNGGGNNAAAYMQLMGNLMPNLMR